ncbi:MAG TPA: protein phosphatase 2C domain-containing protein [Sandaracinaceae bacterium LLY-WYZ-13_1]|nr:protein phosphatase 2C domain-containing protein [Sandaracinaceae bacterium LLY-WYZ-13_1]
MVTDWDGPEFADETLPVLRPKHARQAQTHDVAGRSDVGCVREQNEDTFVIADLGRMLEVVDTSLPVPDAARRISGPKGTLMVVADGMGGHGGGEVASAVAVDVIAQFALYAMPWVTQPDEAGETALLEQLGDAVARCQERLERVAVRKHLDQYAPGTTLTVGYVLWPKLYVAHAGDSRLYLHRRRELVQITTDHTVGQALRDQGAIGPSPSRFDHVLVNVVGGGRGRVQAEAHRLGLEPGDRLLMCSDGLTGHVSDSAIAHELDRAHTSAEACERLVEAAKAGGGSDNVTVLVASY